MTEARFEDLVEVYAPASAVEADRLVLLLDEDGIEAIARETTMSSLPTPADAHYLILVREGSKVKAREIIEAARREGAITSDGELL